MKIFSNETSKFSKPPFFKFSKKSVNKLKFIIPAVTTAVVICTYSPKGQPSLMHAFVNWSKSITTINPKLVLDIPLDEYSKLSSLKNKALKQGVNLDKDDWFKSTLRTSYSSKSIPIKLRLKGDWTDHLENGRWSFRVKTRKNSYYQGMKVFSIQPPATRSYIYESFFQKFLMNEKLPYLRYSFVDLIINGDNKGIYAVEESFSKELIENSGFRDSIILRFTESNFFTRDLWNRKQKSIQMTSPPQIYTIDDKFSFATSSLKSFNSGEIAQSKNLTDLYSKAINSFEKFVSKDQKMIDTFEYTEWAKFYATSDLFQSWHTRRWHNLRLYFNPITGKFIPIGFDASFQDTSTDNKPSFVDQFNGNSSHNHLNLFSDYRFAEAYVREVSRLASKQNLDSFFSTHNKYLNTQLKVINSSFPFVTSMEKKIRLSAEVLLKSIEPPPDPFKIKRYTQSQDSNSKILSLALNSNHYLPIEIISIENNSTIWIPAMGSYLPATNPEKSGTYKKLNFTKVETGESKINNTSLSDQRNLKIKFRTLGSNKVKTQEFTVLNVHNPQTNGELISAIKPNSNNPYPLLFDLDLKNKLLSFSDKNVSIVSTIYIPKGFSIKVASGTTITFKPGASLISYSPIVVEGKSSQRVLFNGTSTSSLLVSNADSLSVINYADFKNFGSMRNVKSQTSGAITFYNSPVDIHNTSFNDNLSEDSLNIFRSNFLLKNVTFKNSKSDALDVDFSKGKILNARFFDIGNDALDFSGSNVTIDGAIISNASDKVISAGEASNLYVKNIFSFDSSVGITSKDSSKVLAENMTFKNVDVCLAVFNKKSFFKGGNIMIDKPPDNCNVPYLVESSSSLSIDNASIGHNATNVESLMYGRKFGKATQK